MDSALNFFLFFSKVLPDNDKKNDNIDNKRQRFFLFLHQKCCPRLSKVVVKKSTTTLTTKDNGSLIPSQKMLSKVVLRCCLKKHDNKDNKRQRFFLFLHQKCCPRLSKVVVRKSHSIRPYFSSSPLRSYCFLFPTGGSVRVIRTTAVRERLRCTASSKASIC